MVNHTELAQHSSILDTPIDRSRHIGLMLDKLTSQNKQLGELLPLLIHCNDPCLPSYDPDIPLCQISHYTPSIKAQQLAQSFFNFQYHSVKAEPLIDGLYTIGSLGSIGQSCNSDWDVWLCINDNNNEEINRKIAAKCYLIEQWAEQLGVELHLFIVTTNQFKQEIKSSFDKESSGSAQHWLLLDEFYRSAIALAGKPIAWHTKEQQQATDYLDFGQPQPIPAQEYFGAMMWQLYKGIDSPEKSLLKAILLESYFNDFPETTLLSQQAQQQLKKGKFTDHYLLLLQRVSKYLIEQQDFERLELARECFYLKCAPGLSYINNADDYDYQQKILAGLTEQWGFTHKKICHLDRCERWSPVDVQHHHQALVSALLKSYQFMKKMAQTHHVDEALYPQELTVLSRKLYSAYQESATKISRLPQQHKARTSTNELFFRRGLDKQQQRQWLLLNQAPVYGKNTIIHEDKKIIKLLAWAAVNQIVSSKTQIKLPIDIAQESHKVNQAIHILSDEFAVKSQATKSALSQASRVEKVILLVNMCRDNTTSFHGQSQIMDWLISNIFSIGSKKHSLVSSIDLVYRNSWNEHHAISFNGDLAILKMLCHLISLIRPADPTPDFSVHSLSAQHDVLLKDHVLFLLKECIAINKKSSKQGIQVKSLVVAGKLYGLFFQQDKVEFKTISSAVELYQQLSKAPLTQLPHQHQTTNKLTRIIYEHGSIGYVQFFLEQQTAGIQVYILDEHNHLSSYWQDQQTEEQLIREIYRFYTFTKEQQNITQEKLAISFNLPQFNRITQNNSVILIEPFDRQADEIF
ncbi:class I adenylate cyclase [Psychrobium sp. 1_MG-2023]|uniref:class I adenylate cyclase n=1 Tax=Psychrobium sp. 1_MG-2023 TaxID=3062624 RepID=UPI000C33DA0E|nr:class I adenylate cyclase [Psychrobium sp. 1_MG-2023]MDP2559545.1 class I adenylate cyclase [Psychrobium sp. 1_MG-2023]PKF59384.1 hypothetical protein CW748_01005 [Alteromonadales bacterium alter-6D02]